MSSTKYLFPVDPNGLDDIATQLLVQAPAPPNPGNPTLLLPQEGFYRIPIATVKNSLSAGYIQFLNGAGYGNLDNSQELRVAKEILKVDQRVIDAAARANVTINSSSNNYLVNINQTDGRKVVEGLGGKLLTTALMYKVFIPYIKQLAQSGNAEAQKTLHEMTSEKAEWLEDIVLKPGVIEKITRGAPKTMVKIGSNEQAVDMEMGNDGRFDHADMNDFGYPTNVRSGDQGEFYYWHPSGNERAAIRGGFPGLGLNLNWAPGDAGDRLGVRVAKIFP